MSELYKSNNQYYIILGVGINIVSSPKVDNYSTTYTSFYNQNINKENFLQYGQLISTKDIKSENIEKKKILEFL